MYAARINGGSVENEFSTAANNKKKKENERQREREKRGRLRRVSPFVPCDGGEDSQVSS